MKYFKSSFGYMFKNFGFVSLIWLLPSVFVGVLCSPYQIINFINFYPTKQIDNFKSIFEILMPFHWLRMLFVIVGVIFVVLFICMAFGEIEAHMRTGKFVLRNLLTYVNNDILVVLVNIVVLTLLNLFLTFIMGCVMFLLHLILSGLTCTPTVLNSIITIVLACLLIVANVFLNCLFLTNILNMLTNGYSLKEGISSTFQLIGKNTFGLLLAYIFPYAIIIPFVSALCRTNFWWIPGILCTYFQYMYYCCLCLTSFFDLSNTPRYDNRKYYNYNK